MVGLPFTFYYHARNPMKKMPLVLMAACCFGMTNQIKSESSESIELTCTAIYTENRLNDLRKQYLSPIEETIENLFEATMREGYMENIINCAKQKMPAAEYIIIIKIFNFENTGNHSATLLIRDCQYMGPKNFYVDRKILKENLADVEVTQNFLRIKGAGLQIDKRTLTGTQKLDSLGGPYPVKCSY